jgi:hypothetical protein
MLFNYSCLHHCSRRKSGTMGQYQHKGIELTLNATPYSTKDFSWNTAFNLAHNKNEITNLQGPLANSDSIRYSDPKVRARPMQRSRS